MKSLQILTIADMDFIKDTYPNNDLGKRDMDLIVEELIEAGVVDDLLRASLYCSLQKARIEVSLNYQFS
jgi:hypothetical protein